MSNLRFSIFLLLTICLFSNVSGQIRIGGIVRDAVTRESLIGAHLILNNGSVVGVTDNNGFFTLQVSIGSHSLQASYIGYKTKKAPLFVSSDTILHIFLSPDTNLEEVVVKAGMITSSNTHRISGELIDNLPVISGKPDVGKALHLMPGISGTHEASSTLIVRGGGPGENLYMLDGIPLTYVHHLGGFSSVFNPEILNDVTVYKGGFPSRFGGKLSSVIDITQREGNKNSYKGSLDIGVTDASFSFEGPLIKDEAGFIISGRKTMFDPLLIWFTNNTNYGNVFYYGFHDINVKATWDVSPSQKLTWFIYHGDDYLVNRSGRKGSASGVNYRHRNVWGNWLTALRWQHLINSSTFFNSSLSYSRYRIQSQSKSESLHDNSKFERLNQSALDHYLFQNWIRNDLFPWWKMRLGLDVSIYRHSRFYADKMMEQEAIQAYEPIAYIENDISVSDKIEISPGFRYVLYNSTGYRKYSYEPRLSVGYFVTEKQRIGFDYSRVRQFNHHIQSATGGFNNELWLPSDDLLPPSRSDQWSLGWTGLVFDGDLDFGISLYHKRLYNLISFRDGYETPLNNPDLNKFVNVGGKGTVEGLEFFLNRNRGVFTGSLNYTLSDANRIFPDVNDGIAYNYEFNAKHSVSLFLNVSMSDRWSINGLWTFHSGLPYTPVIGRHTILDPNMEFGELPFEEEALVYGKRNSNRMSSYHRMDVSLVNRGYTRWNHLKREWRFGIYNLYNRHNPAYYRYARYFDNPGYQGTDDYMPFNLYSVSYFSIIPSVSYKVYFGERGNGRKSADGGFFKRFKRWFFYEVD
ncbi:Outer membrane receptor for ferrienterochelin and colicins [Alkalitalea saponilacus]|uniref:Outer membrane receptor for ferrienterochelin and colicins n=1 Tax=Alkalitalea saponilacus TaxID=889453 RepID=A0A1T5AXM0_9BACT|nr:Outer membrane receptor for ferrienterochelin and colicins [Alkalitalea saponilacus]